MAADVISRYCSFKIGRAPFREQHLKEGRRFFGAREEEQDRVTGVNEEEAAKRRRATKKPRRCDHRRPSEQPILIISFDSKHCVCVCVCAMDVVSLTTLL